MEFVKNTSAIKACIYESDTAAFTSQPTQSWKQ